ncbi:OmpA family protein [Candidatus Halobeggiatoa sp. HSG11]|nr:OmpA family protein [Candidatus Halobeggiatoa sp. HSG11]
MFKFILLLAIVVLSSCLSIPTKESSYLEFNTGISQLTNSLMTDLQRFKLFKNTSNIVLNPFLDVDNGQILQASLDIEKLIIAETQKHFKYIDIARIEPQKLTNARYVLNGIIKYEANKSAQKKHYKISASIVDLTNKSIVTNHTVYIQSSGLNYQPTPSYQDNPMYFKGKPLQHIISSVNSPVGSKIDTSYYDFVKIKALLTVAQQVYDEGKYKQAYILFKNILKQPSSEIIEIYGGLYAVTFKLGLLKEAEVNFSKMVAIGMQQGTLPIKFLFKTDLTNFLNIPELKQQYNIWLRQISKYLKNNSDKCIHIIGHTSISGLYKYNKKLSKSRANNIQKRMSKIFRGIMQRSKTIGKGSDEVIVGTKPDSNENAIDRRVEFKVVDCLD